MPAVNDAILRPTINNGKIMHNLSRAVYMHVTFVHLVYMHLAYMHLV